MKAADWLPFPAVMVLSEGEEHLARKRSAIGFPLILESGRRGWRARHAHGPHEGGVLAVTRRPERSAAAFGTPDVYMESICGTRPYRIPGARDQHGKVIHLGEGECHHSAASPEADRRKPSPAMDAKRRKEIGAKVVKALELIGYTNAGTIEFLMDDDGAMYFIEMNTRIQVEHPVTKLSAGWTW